jgi:hypothetical protein
MPLDCRIEPPDMLRALEGALHSIRVYSTGKMYHGQWSYTPGDALSSWDEMDGATNWWAGIRAASEKLELRRGSPAGFAQLSKCFEQFTSHPGLEEFSMVWCTYSAILLLSEVGTSSPRCSAKYVVQMAHIKYGRYHPISQRWSQIQRLDGNVRREAFASMMRLKVSLVQECAQPGSPSWMTLAVASLASACSQRLVNSEEGINQLNQAINVGSQPASRGHDKQPLHYSLRLTAGALTTLISTYTTNGAKGLSWGEMPLDFLLQLENSYPEQLETTLNTLPLRLLRYDGVRRRSGER